MTAMQPTFLFLAWRNTFRNTRRSLLTCLTVGGSLAALMILDGLVTGCRREMIRSATGTFMGEGQIHHADFLQSRNASLTIPDPELLLGRLRDDPGIASVASRTIMFAMVASPAGTGAAALYGLDPEEEAKLSRLPDLIVQGQFLTAAGRESILLGDRLARRLQLAAGSRAVLMLARPGGGEPVQEMFRVAGVLRTGMRELDDSLAVVTLARSRELLANPGAVHEIAIRFTRPDPAGAGNPEFVRRYSGSGLQALDWRGLLPPFADVVDISYFVVQVAGIVLMIMVAAGIMNTLFMSLHERMYEFAVVKALGTTPWQVARTVVWEAGWLSLLGILTGWLMGSAAMVYYRQAGLQLAGIEYAGVVLAQAVYPEFRIWQFTTLPGLLLAFTLLIALVPALRAARLSPASAMTKEGVPW